MPPAGDDHVINQGRAEHGRGPRDHVRKFDVFGARRGIAARVVVHQDERAGRFAHGGAKHVPRIDRATMQPPFGDAPRGAQPVATVERLSARARHRRIAPRTLAQRYVEEGLRMDEHPLLRFVDGPAGRRARLVGSGLDVWEVIEVLRDNDGDVAAAADYLELPLGLVQAAVTYYGAYPEEIDEWIEANRREREEAHAAWLAGQAALRR